MIMRMKKSHFYHEIQTIAYSHKRRDSQSLKNNTPTVRDVINAGRSATWCRLPFIESQIGQVQIKEGNVFGTYLEEAI